MKKSKKINAKLTLNKVNIATFEGGGSSFGYSVFPCTLFCPTKADCGTTRTTTSPISKVTDNC